MWIRLDILHCTHPRFTVQSIFSWSTMHLSTRCYPRQLVVCFLYSPYINNGSRELSWKVIGTAANSACNLQSIQYETYLASNGLAWWSLYLTHIFPFTVPSGARENPIIQWDSLAAGTRGRPCSWWWGKASELGLGGVKGTKCDKPGEGKEGVVTCNDVCDVKYATVRRGCEEHSPPLILCSTVRTDLPFLVCWHDYVCVSLVSYTYVLHVLVSLQMSRSLLHWTNSRGIRLFHVFFLIMAIVTCIHLLSVS